MRNKGKLNKLVGILLSLFLLAGSFSPYLPVYGEDIPAIPPTSAPAPREAISAPAPTSAPAPRDPTKAPDPTSVPETVNPTSVPDSITAPSPTGSNIYTPTPTGTENSTGNPAVTPTGSVDSTAVPTGVGIGDTQSQYGEVNDPKNTLTGPGSTNYATENNTTTVSTENSNKADLLNKLNAISNSGFNTANLNTLNGNVYSGDSFSTLTILNKLNSNFSGYGNVGTFNIYDNHTGDITFTMADSAATNSFSSATPTVSSNSGTGPNSDNIADANNKVIVNEANGNDAKINNDINLSAVTGGNAASQNTGNGTVKTGDATAFGNILNFANTNLSVDKWLIGIVNIFGNLAGNIILPHDAATASSSSGTAGDMAINSNTGPDSDNIASTDNNKSTEINNTNNANINTDLDMAANTGENQSNLNTGGGSVATGNSEVDVNKTTVANTNATGDTVWLVIVNQLGKWVGFIVGAPYGSKVASSSNMNALTQTGTGNNSGNNMTGPDSNNQASVSNSEENSTVNTNNATINNNIKVSADTGHNDASYNTGAGNIQTGDAKAGLNLVDFVNTNVVAKKFVTILVNVFGSFVGDIIPPDQKASGTTTLSMSGSTNTAGGSVTPTASPTGITSGNETTLQNQDQNNQEAVSGNSSRIGGVVSFDEASDNGSFSDQVQAVSYSDNYNQSPASNSRNLRVTNGGRQNVSLWYSDYISTNYGPTPLPTQVPAKTGSLRGVFLSPVFAKESEPTAGGMLFAGTKLRINIYWLTFIPATFLFMLIKRRRRFISQKIIKVLEVIL
ncbi:MAG: hypothetical protein UT63_C0063G0016 [Candidatus Gottesmanbacteria bacterium GW2011_GWC2_39_8]|uniref:Uncharacterized protein n=1 Tax=Candidatus Gottesmanbacteria bacterium GW2011_GWC2_39_8 TaxID=1618450 RepID=A0A0G0PUY5_9BACT|nr:MAG: hypothetical protein UT63_C0063G0016 [Candidatus Gottesmanbacteria bacterium GW2011_GWC2_39_8]